MIRDILIHPVLNGYVVTVGCQTVVFEKGVHLLNTLEDYLKNPDEVEKDFITNSVNAKFLPILTATPSISSTSQLEDSDEIGHEEAVQRIIQEVDSGALDPNTGAGIDIHQPSD